MAIAAGFVQSLVGATAADAAVALVFSCAILVGSGVAPAMGACSAPAEEATVNAVAAVALPKKARRVLPPRSSCDMSLPHTSGND
jgi:hypothetical protein